jgi:hypothetical protein
MARRYNRDSRGRFASGGGGGGSRRPAPRGISRGTNRLTRDNSGRITSVGGDGATARGGRLRTASGKQRATQTARISGGRAAGTVTRSGARRTAAAAAAKPVRRGLTGKGKAPSTRLPSANSDQYKYNKAGLIATPQERSQMRGRDRAREKNAALAQQQAAGRLRAERRAARRMTSASAEPGSVSRYSSTFNAAERALRRRSQRADSNFADSVKLERSKAQLTAKAVKMQNQAAQRKAEGKPITKTMESNFQKLRRDIAKIDRSLQTRRRALEVTSSASQRMEINTRNRR